MRLLHTADWHLGRIFYRVHLTDDQAHVLDQLVAVVRDTRPHAVIVAGDLYDRAVPPPEAVTLLDDVVCRIVLDLGVPLVMVSGNHDSADRLRFGSRMLARQALHLETRVSTDPSPLVLDDAHGGVAIYALPFAAPAVVRQVLADEAVHSHDAALAAQVARIQRARSPSHRAVLVAHVHAEGGRASESERPLVMGSSAIVRSANFEPFDYVALGHLHLPQVIGRPAVRYAGSLLKYSFAEHQDVKSVSLVELDSRGRVEVEAIPLSPRHDVRRIEGHFDDLLRGVVQSDARFDDYVEITLLDKEPILDAMARLRRVYPNALNLVRPHFEPRQELMGPTEDHRRADPVDLFAEFYEQVTGTPLTDAERDVVVSTATNATDEETSPQPGSDSATDAG